MAFTRYTGTLTGQVGSLTTALDAALVTGQGWTIAFTATNKRVYRQAAGNRFYFRVDDTGAGTGGLREALIRGAESWTNIDTPNVNPFPSNSQSGLTANSLVLRKSATLDATTRNYVLYADDRTAILFVQPDAPGTYSGPWYFGDIYSLVSGDPYRTVLLARNIENNTVPNYGGTPYEPLCYYYGAGDSYAPYFGDSSVGSGGNFMARNYLGTGTSLPFRHASDFKFQAANSTQQHTWRGSIPTPNDANGGLYLTRFHIFEYSGTPARYVYRGRLRGLWGWCHSTQPYSDGDTMSGAGELAGKNFQLLTIIQSAGVDTAAVEISATVETN